MASPRSTMITRFLSSVDEIAILSITWKDITLKKVRFPVSSDSIALDTTLLTRMIQIFVTQKYVVVRLLGQ